ncbi:MAG: type II secretion system F family protein [Candidatus Saccharibacteria bacterium]
MEFTYQARDNKGTLRTGTVEAISLANASEMLQSHGLIIIKVMPVAKFSVFDRVSFFDSVPMKDLVMFSRQLATLINAKVPIVQSLKILELQVSSTKLKTVIAEVASKVESGESLSVAIAGHPKIFSPLYVSLVHAGELSGGMDEALMYLATQMEKDYDLRSKVIGALTYPLFIVFAIIIVGILMFIYVLPPMISILKESEVELPFTTKILVAVTDFMKAYWWLLLSIIVGGLIGLKAWLSTYGGKFAFDYFKINVPIFGKLSKNVYMARFARNLSTLVAGGIPIVKALDSVADIVGNHVYRNIIFEASEQVRNGKGIAMSLVDRPEFPPIVSQMTQIGESTGKLQEILDKLATFYEKEVEQSLKTLTTLIEPIVMLLLGLAVAIMVAGILLPMYNLASAS